MKFNIFKKHPNHHGHNFELRYHHKMHKDEWMWCCTDAPTCYGRDEWWRVWVLFGFRSNPFAGLHDYELSRRPSRWYERVKCATVGHNYTEWQPRLAWSFSRICRCCRDHQLESGEDMGKDIGAKI